MSTVLESCDERSDILERRASHNLGAWVQEESVVKALQALRIFIHRRDLGNLSNHIGTGLTHFPFLILSQRIVKWEHLQREGVSRDILGHVGQVLSECTAHARLLVHSQCSELVHNERFVDLGAHVAGDFIQQLDGRFAKFVLLIVGQVQC